MRLLRLELNGFKSFGKRALLDFNHNIVAIVGPNGSGKSNVVESFRFVLGEQSMKSMRGKTGGDLIFKGSKTLQKGSSAKVSLVFDNTDQVLKIMNEAGEYVKIGYDTVTISREVLQDGGNTYTLNNAESRLKDINNLLASVHIGSSGHHIISQGEADRILNANQKELREMVEDALGLKFYQYKIRESERKLERSQENMKEITILSRENAPHLNFLKKQVDKFEKAREMKEELLSLYAEYTSRENFYIKKEKDTIVFNRSEVLKKIEEVRNALAKISDDSETRENPAVEKLRELESKVSELYRLRDNTERKLGRTEGMIEAYEHREKPSESATISISREDADHFLREMREYLEEAGTMDMLDSVLPMIERMKDILARFAKNFETTDESPKIDLTELYNTQKELLAEIDKTKLAQEELNVEIKRIKGEISMQVEGMREKEQEKFALKMKMQEYSSELSMIDVKMEGIFRRETELYDELREANALVQFNPSDQLQPYEDIDEVRQEDLKRQIERIKIRLEDAGLSGEADIRKEYQEALEREAFLSRELEDLESSIHSLELLIADLKEKIDREFQEGVKKINKEFCELFALMFGGGEGKLSVTEIKKRKEKDLEDEDEYESEDSEEDTQMGLEISVSLPHKKVKELQALSGGERSLTSIALLFAMSQVNPPPFLILDETDAALDEANSRKYGDMLEKLSKHSQLIVVTHNRETMSRAGILYGVTVGSDGASKILSVKFEEAQVIAK